MNITKEIMNQTNGKPYAKLFLDKNRDFAFQEPLIYIGSLIGE